ncbi:11420_t:CDS:2 [Ambispora leptoticha]|uniref:11420_t:CDS:1 n=1 Tax=Ambispora leptoticha TaxID=144679 RepID=A0A9N8WQJ3_9GLOM|nr:11420_t:CDS:2 [Ambispora leptoticha]
MSNDIEMNNIVIYNDEKMGNENDFSKALKELLKAFSSITSSGEHDKHLQECIHNWFSQHQEFTEIQIFEDLKQMGDELGKCDLADVLLHGIGTNADVHRALKLYLEAKNLGCMQIEQHIRKIFLKLH